MVGTAALVPLALTAIDRRFVSELAGGMVVKVGNTTKHSRALVSADSLQNARQQASRLLNSRLGLCVACR